MNEILHVILLNFQEISGDNRATWYVFKFDVNENYILFNYGMVISY